MIEVEALTVRYGAFTAVSDVAFSAAAGRVTGFLGPNGAGKSTAMRVMAGLTRPTTGRSGCSSTQHAGRTGREILTIAQRTMRVPASRVDEMLDRVSLTPSESRRRVRNPSSVS